MLGGPEKQPSPGHLLRESLSCFHIPPGLGRAVLYCCPLLSFIFSHILSDYGRMTDTERDQIDQDAQIFMRTCSEAIQQLRAEGELLHLESLMKALNSLARKTYKPTFVCRSQSPDLPQASQVKQHYSNSANQPLPIKVICISLR